MLSTKLWILVKQQILFLFANCILFPSQQFWLGDILNFFIGKIIVIHILVYFLPILFLCTFFMSTSLIGASEQFRDLKLTNRENEHLLICRRWIVSSCNPSVLLLCTLYFLCVHRVYTVIVCTVSSSCCVLLVGCVYCVYSS